MLFVFTFCLSKIRKHLMFKIMWVRKTMKCEMFTVQFGVFLWFCRVEHFIAQGLDVRSQERDKIPAQRKTANVIPNLYFSRNTQNPLARFLLRIREKRTTQAEDSL